MECGKNKIRRNWKGIDQRLLRTKLHYFLLYGGLGAIQPYLSLNAQQLGLTATAAGLVYTILPFTYIFSKPLIGAISDYFHNMKAITMVLVMTTAVLWCMILVIPPMELARSPTMIPMKCGNNSSQIISVTNYQLQCLISFENISSECNVHIENSSTVTTENVDFCPKVCNNSTMEGGMILKHVPTVINDGYIEASISNYSLCHCPDMVFNLMSCNSSLQSCLFPENLESRNVYKTKQFWGFAAIMFISGTALASALSITDAACYELLGEDSELYGRQRLWGTVSSGTASFISGILFDAASERSGYTNYAPGFYIMLIMLSLDLIIIYKIDVTQKHSAENIFKNVGRAFVSAKTITFAIGAFLIGVLTPLVLHYETWFLKDLGASQFLIGLSMAVECLLAEVPFLFISGRIIKKFGHFYCLLSAFAAFFLRFIYYYFLVNPWYVLPIELLHGITYGVFYATITSYAHAKAPKGAEATMFGVLGGLYDGLGMATGSILSGVSYDYLGGRQTFLVATISSSIMLGIFLFLNLVFKTLTMKTKQRHGLIKRKEEEKCIAETTN